MNESVTVLIEHGGVPLLHLPSLFLFTLSLKEEVIVGHLTGLCWAEGLRLEDGGRIPSFSLTSDAGELRLHPAITWTCLLIVPFVDLIG